MLKNKVAIITGSSRGIGNKIAEEYLRNGAKVVVCGRSKESGEKAAEELVNKGFSEENVMGIGIDFSDTESLKKDVDSVVEKWGRIDILVNNAGCTNVKDLVDMEDGEMEEMYAINVFGVVKITRLVLQYMKNTGGAIINTSSMVGVNGGAHQTAYASSKTAVNGLTITWAKELGQYNIRVNAIAPGVIETDMVKKNVDEATKNYLTNITPLKRTGKVEDLAAAYVYFGSDAATFTTGNILKIDGGLVF